MLTTVLVIAAFLLALYFPVMLYLRSDYKANPPIVGLMVFSCIIAGVLGLAVYRQIVEPPSELARNIVYFLIIIGLFVQDVILTNTQNRRAARIKRERREGIERLKEKETQR